jgi:FixJ family two-component response regulator
MHPGKEIEATVFVIDDDQSMREALKTLLSSVGLRVATFASAQEFLQCCPGMPGCLVLDVSLLALDHCIMSFITNPLFKQPNVVDSQNALKARSDLNLIVRLSKELKTTMGNHSKAGGNNGVSNSGQP